MANVPTDLRRRSAGQIRISQANPYQGLLTASEQMGRAKSQGMESLRRQQQQLQRTEQQALASTQGAQSRAGMVSIRAARDMGRAELAAARSMGGAQMDLFDSQQAAMAGLTDGIVRTAGAMDDVQKRQEEADLRAAEEAKRLREKNEVVRFEAEQLSFDNYVARRRVELSQELAELETNFTNEKKHWEAVEEAVSSFRADLNMWRSENTSGQFDEEFAVAEDALITDIEVEAASRVPAIQREYASNQYTVAFNDLLASGDYQRAYSLAQRKLPNIMPDPGSADVKLQEARNLIIENALGSAEGAAEEALLNPDLDNREAAERARAIWGNTYANLRAMFGDEDLDILSEANEASTYTAISRKSSDAIIDGFLQSPDMGMLQKMREGDWSKETVMSALDLQYTPSRDRWPAVQANLKKAYQQQSAAVLEQADELVDQFLKDDIPYELFVQEIDQLPQLDQKVTVPMTNPETGATYLADVPVIQHLRQEALAQRQNADNETAMEEGLERAEEDPQYMAALNAAELLGVAPIEKNGWTIPQLGPGNNLSFRGLVGSMEDLEVLYTDLLQRGYGPKANVKLTKAMVRLARYRTTAQGWPSGKRFGDNPDATLAVNRFYNGVRSMVEENPNVNWLTMQGSDGTGLYRLVQDFNGRLEERFGSYVEQSKDWPEDQRREWLKRNVDGLLDQLEMAAVEKQVRGMQ